MFYLRGQNDLSVLEKKINSSLKPRKINIIVYKCGILKYLGETSSPIQLNMRKTEISVSFSLELGFFLTALTSSLMLLKFFPYPTACVSLVTVLFCLYFLPLCRSSVLYAVVFSTIIQGHRHYIPSEKVLHVLEEKKQPQNMHVHFWIHLVLSWLPLSMYFMWGMLKVSIPNCLLIQTD